MKIKGEEWKILAKDKLRVAEWLIRQKKWTLAAEQLGYVLECALKAACSKNMRHDFYPPVRPSQPTQEIGNFKTHEFEALLVYSGLSDVLGTNSFAWGNFVSEYPGNSWVEMRYDINAKNRFSESKVRDLYESLYTNNDSILKVMSRKKRW